MKKLLLLALLATLTVPAFAQNTYACVEECVPADEATVETPEEDICAPQRGMVPLNVNVMRNAMLQRYINKLEKLGGTYTGGNRFQVMKQIFEIEKLA